MFHRHFIHRNNISPSEATERLKALLDTPFDVCDAIGLFRQHGADPNTRNAKGHTLLTLLARNESNIKGKYNDLIKELVEEYGASVDILVSYIPDAEKQTALQHLISGEFHINAAMGLVRLKAYPNVKNFAGNTLLSIIAHPEKNTGGQYNRYIEELVKKYGAHIDIQNAKNQTPLQTLISIHDFCIHDAMVLVRLGANHHAENSCGYSLLSLLEHETANIKGRYNRYIKELNEISKKEKARLEKILHTSTLERDLQYAEPSSIPAVVINDGLGKKDSVVPNNISVFTMGILGMFKSTSAPVAKDIDELCLDQFARKMHDRL